MNSSFDFMVSEKFFLNARNIVFIFFQIVILMINIDSNLSKIKVCYYIKIRIPIRHRQFLRIISQNQEYVKSVFKELKKVFSFCLS